MLLKSYQQLPEEDETSSEVEGPMESKVINFIRQLRIMLRLKLRLMREDWKTASIVIGLSWLLFVTMLLVFWYAHTSTTSIVSLKTVDLAYKAMENFIFLSVSGIFLYSQLDDHKSHRRHLLRVQTGLRNSAYYLSYLIADLFLFLLLNLPSVIMLAFGYRKLDLPYVSETWLITIEVLSKMAFGCVLLPLIYLIGFLQRKNAESVYKSLGLILYVIGHLFNMIMLSMVCYQTRHDYKLCSFNESLVLILPMLSPFTFYFFNSTLDYFLCPDL